jgi:hypothetical protein
MCDYFFLITFLLSLQNLYHQDQFIMDANERRKENLTNMTGPFAAILVGLEVALANTAKSDLE